MIPKVNVLSCNIPAGSAMIKAKICNEIPSHCDGIDLEDPEHADKTECKSANKLFEALADDVASGDMQFSKGEVVEGSFRALDTGASQCLAVKDKDKVSLSKCVSVNVCSQLNASLF